MELPEIMSLEERKARLSKMARIESYTRQFHAASVIEAIDTLNKIDGVYKQTIEVQHQVRHTFIFKLPDGTTFTPGLPSPDIIEGEAREVTND